MPPVPRVIRTVALGALLLGLIGPAVPQPPPLVRPPMPPRPEKFKAYLRYYIVAQRDQHVAEYKAMLEHLERVGFEPQPKLKPFWPPGEPIPNTDYENREKTVLSGLLPSNRILTCLENPHVAQLVLLPPNYDLPEDPAQPVRVRIELASGLPPQKQFLLANQARVLLSQFDFKESVGYDHRGYTGQPFTRLVGTLPAEYLQAVPLEFGKQNVELPPLMLKDLRSQPTGWLASRLDPTALPAPVREQVPIRVTEVIAEPEPAKDVPRPERRGQEYLDKISADLWALVTSKDDENRVVRGEIILAYTPAAGDDSFREGLVAAAPSLLVDGRIGPVVTGIFRANQAAGLARLPQVSVVRLARPALVHTDPAAKFPGDNARALKQSGLAEWHARGFRGQGVRVGIVDSDFRKYQEFVKAGKLPANTQLVDLTTEYNSDFRPDPPTGDENAIGHGTHCALAVALAAPDAEITLIRIDPTSLVQMQLVAKLVNGDPAMDANLARRADELQAAQASLTNRHLEIAAERKAILDNFEDEIDIRREYEILGPHARGWLFSSRDWHLRRVAELDRDRKRHARNSDRFYQFYHGLQRLKGLHIVTTSLVWNDGYPLAGVSPLSRWFDETPGRKALWFVSAGNTRGQTWTGPYRDHDRNGVMEFAAPEVALPPGSWTHELSFLAWQPHVGERSLSLPKGATVRISMQWAEPHDPSLAWKPDLPDLYLKPLADMTLVALKQRDPTGKVLPGDDFEVVGRSATPAQRIDHQANGSTYEQVVEFTVPADGRYAFLVQRTLDNRWEMQPDPVTGQPVVVERTGLAPTGTRPVGAAVLPNLEPAWELKVRLFVQVADPASFGKGRVVFRDYQTNQGSIPILADASRLIGVGAAGLDDGPQPYTAAGAPGTLWNVLKPNVLAYDELALAPEGAGSAYGASVATPFAGGCAAVILSGGGRAEELETSLLKQQAKLLRLPRKGG
jgi:hypothetical protein